MLVTHTVQIVCSGQLKCCVLQCIIARILYQSLMLLYNTQHLVFSWTVAKDSPRGRDTCSLYLLITFVMHLFMLIAVQLAKYTENSFVSHFIYLLKPFVVMSRTSLYLTGRKGSAKPFRCRDTCNCKRTINNKRLQVKVLDSSSGRYRQYIYERLPIPSHSTEP